MSQPEWWRRRCVYITQSKVHETSIPADVLDQSDAAMSLPEEAWAQDDDGPPRHFGFIAKDKKDLVLWFLIRAGQDYSALSCGATLTLSIGKSAA
ncbi:unnamed protein product [Clonostachys rosea f. rosea IK726]|uniref:Uncharacterized protein n=1 Tax=Clonostachys rosea f. rosea IK726 TaxID=1349383 RepID=A0ACA9U0F9_BIOOC|nr:unnamed protein product [Clonostachys rosea f. rosea IK726]